MRKRGDIDLKIFQVLNNNNVVSEHSTLKEAIREAVVTGNLEIITVNKAEYYSRSRKYSMSKLPPPQDYSWYHLDLGEQDGDDIVMDTGSIEREFRRIRREWLSQFEMTTSGNEGGFKYWRWTDSNGKVVWTERRPWAEAEVFKGEPGFYPRG